VVHFVYSRYKKEEEFLKAVYETKQINERDSILSSIIWVFTPILGLFSRVFQLFLLYNYFSPYFLLFLSNTLKFVFDEVRLQDHNSIGDAGNEDGDTIEVIEEQRGD
jgi:hypothetical protein